MTSSIAFGPVPSRRLGMSLGINNIPPKVCSYSCVYCQLGNTLKSQTERTEFFEPEEIVQAVYERIGKVESSGERIDYLTFVPDGEPTLDLNLGMEIEALKDTGIKVAVMTNSSLLWMHETREDLEQADWVSVKVDTVDPTIWMRINRPSPDISIKRVMDGIVLFSEEFEGTLVTETMLVDGLNDEVKTFRMNRDFIKQLNSDIAYISIPTRPPAEPWVKPPSEEKVNQAYQIYMEKISHVELLTGYEGNSFAFTGDPVEDILGITSVHPMRREAILQMLTKANAGWSLIEDLIAAGQLKEIEYSGFKFYMKVYST